MAGQSDIHFPSPSFTSSLTSQFAQINHQIWWTQWIIIIKKLNKTYKQSSKSVCKAFWPPRVSVSTLGHSVVWEGPAVWTRCGVTTHKNNSLWDLKHIAGGCVFFSITIIAFTAQSNNSNKGSRNPCKNWRLFKRISKSSIVYDDTLMMNVSLVPFAGHINRQEFPFLCDSHQNTMVTNTQIGGGRQEAWPVSSNNANWEQTAIAQELIVLFFRSQLPLFQGQLELYGRNHRFSCVLVPFCKSLRICVFRFQ